MIRFGRYDVFDKWDIVCRSSATPDLDVGTDRHGKILLPEWQVTAFAGGSRACRDYLRLKCEALARGAAGEPGDNGDESELNRALSRLLAEIGAEEFEARSFRLVDALREQGPVAATQSELPSVVAQRLAEVYRSGALLALRWTDDPGEIPDIEVMRSKMADIVYLRESGIESWRSQSVFPSDAIKGRRKKVLSMFCARFYGLMDVINIYDISPGHVTLVDRDGDCINAMQKIYPQGWSYIQSDYEDFLRQAEEQNLVYDLVVTDPWAAQCKEVGLDGLQRMMDRCEDLYVTHYTQKMLDELGVDLEDLDGLSRAIGQWTGIDVTVTATLRRSYLNAWVAMRRRAGSQALSP